MINLDDYTNENKTEHNSKWPHIPDHPYRLLIINQILIEYICMQMIPMKQNLINKREKVGIDHFNDLKFFIEHSNDMQLVYKNIEEYNPNKKCKVLIVFDDMIADMINNKKLNPILTELLIRGRKLNISIVFIK